MEHVPTARDYMKPNAFALSPEQDVYEAIDALSHAKVAAAPVVDDEHRLVGILTEKDCLRVVSSSVWGQFEVGSVADYMSEPRAAVTPEMDLFTIVQVFVATHFASLPVLDEGTLVGMISRQDLLRGVREIERRFVSGRQKRGKTLHTLQEPASSKSSNASPVRSAKSNWPRSSAIAIASNRVP